MTAISTERPWHGQSRALRGQAGARAFAPPVFILAPARSFSTVTVAMLSMHPDLFGFPEMLLCSAETVGGLLAEASRRPGLPARWARWRLTGVARAVAEIHDARQDEADLRRAWQWLASRGDWTTFDLMDHLLELVDPLVGLEKSPDSVVSDDALAALVRAYPQARFLHLTRHPATTMRSMLEHWDQSFDGADVRVRVAHCASAWYLSHRRILTTLDSLPASRSRRVRGEDLLCRPESTLPGIADWLGIDSSPATLDRLRHPEHWRFARLADDRSLNWGDPKFMNAPRLRPVPEPGPVVFPAEYGIAVDMHRAMVALADRLGYPAGG
jgi:hypothetical protein